MPLDFLRKLRPVYSPHVLVIVYAPVKDGQPLYQSMGWGDPLDLCDHFIQNVRRLSGDRLVFRYEKENIITVPDFPVAEDGRKYTLETWEAAQADDTQALRVGQRYAMADYSAILTRFNLLALIDQKKYDEVWLLGGPLFGFYESRMVGQTAVWCNSPGLNVSCRNFVMMGFSYERGDREMLHDLGHRAESLVNLHDPVKYKAWVTVHGTVHFAPGSTVEYSNDEYKWLAALLPGWWKYVARV
jgi:hypothetical protein